jgi:hypothetical protein
MGYDISLIILHQDDQSVRKIPKDANDPSELRRLPAEQWPHKKYFVWRGKEIISIGRVTRVEKMEDPNYAGKQSGREIAGICAGSWLTQKLAKNQGLGRQDFAPPFLVSKESDHTGFMWEQTELDYETLAGGEVFVGPVHSSLTQWSSPARDTMLAHNKLLKLSGAKFEEILKRDVVMSPLVRWESCVHVASWLGELLVSESYNRKVLVADDKALAYLRMWETTLRELGAFGARVLFVFDHSTDLTFV